MPAVGKPGKYHLIQTGYGCALQYYFELGKLSNKYGNCLRCLYYFCNAYIYAISMYFWDVCARLICLSLLDNSCLLKNRDHETVTVNSHFSWWKDIISSLV